jgi:hypothetical protein
MDYFTKLSKVYATPNQEASTIAEALVTNFFCRFGIPRELHSDQGHNFESRLLQETLERIGGAKRAPHPYIPSRTVWWRAIWRRGKNTCGRSSRRSKGTGTGDYPFYPSLQGSHSWHNGIDSSPSSFRERTSTALRPAIRGTPRQGTTHNGLCSRLSGPPTWHSKLRPQTPEAGQRPDEN